MERAEYHTLPKNDERDSDVHRVPHIAVQRRGHQKLCGSDRGWSTEAIHSELPCAPHIDRGANPSDSGSHPGRRSIRMPTYGADQPKRYHDGYCTRHEDCEEDRVEHWPEGMPHCSLHCPRKTAGTTLR